jgi:hypothetical protein
MNQGLTLTVTRVQLSIHGPVVDFFDPAEGRGDLLKRC